MMRKIFLIFWLSSLFGLGCSTPGSFGEGQAFCSVALSDRHQLARDIVQCFIPTDALPSGIRIVFRARALQGIVEAVGVINEFRSDFSLDAYDAAVWMVMVRIEANNPTLFDSRNGRAVRGAKGAVAAHRIR